MRPVAPGPEEVDDGQVRDKVVGLFNDRLPGTALREGEGMCLEAWRPLKEQLRK